MKYESKPKALFRNAFSGSARVPSQSQVLSLKLPMRVVVLAEKNLSFQVFLHHFLEIKKKQACPPP